MNYPVGLGVKKYNDSLLHLFTIKELVIVPGETNLFVSCVTDIPWTPNHSVYPLQPDCNSVQTWQVSSSHIKLSHHYLAIEATYMSRFDLPKDLPKRDILLNTITPNAAPQNHYHFYLNHQPNTRWTVFHQGSSTHITCTSTFNTDTPTVSSKLTWSNLKSACLELFPSMTISEISTIMENVDLLDSINHLSVLMDVNFSSLEECIAISKKVYESSFLVPDSVLTKICQVLMHLKRQT